MSDPSDPAYGIGGRYAYAPRRARRTEGVQRRDVRMVHDRGIFDEYVEPINLPQEFAATDRSGEWTGSAEDTGSANDAAPADADDEYLERIRARLSIDPAGPKARYADLRRTLRIRGSQRGMLGLFGRLILAVSIAAIAALVVSGRSADWRVAPGQRSADATMARRIDQAGSPPQLVAVQSSVRGSDEELPLGLAVEGPDDGAALLVTGLATGASLTTGREFGNGWRVAATDIGRTMLRRPPGFVGPMDLTLELRLPDETVADRRSWRLEWVAPASPSTGAASAPGGAAAAAAKQRGTQDRDIDAEQDDKPPPRLDAATIAALSGVVKRAEELIAVGDISAARVLLRRAAEARDSRAAFALGATYDPIALDKLGVRGTIADVAMARIWYDKAREFGSSEAQERIEKLATMR